MIGLIFVSVSEAAVVDTEKNNDKELETQSKTSGNVIDLGEMRIEEKKCRINLKHDNMIPVEECNPYETYVFIVQYYFHEASINQERWIFRMSMQTGANGESEVIKEKIIDDTWGLTDISSGELFIEIKGHELWDSKDYNYLTFDCETLSDIAWLSNWSLVDESHEMSQVTVRSYLEPNLKINAIDGTDFGAVGIRLVYPYPKKIFVLKNEGNWVAKNITYELMGHGDFSITEGPDSAFDLAANQKTQITFTFDPQSHGDKNAVLRANDGGYLYSSQDVNLKGYGKITNPKNNAFSFSFLSTLFEKSPLFERLLINLIS